MSTMGDEKDELIGSGLFGRRCSCCSAHDVWKEEIAKARTCDTKEKKKEFQHVAVSKYHVKRGTRIDLYCNGWTSDGQVYFGTICKEISDMVKNSELWSTLKLHWSLQLHS